MEVQEQDQEYEVKWFMPLKGKPKARTILAFDIEGSGREDGFVCGAIAGEFVSGFYTDREEMWCDLLEYGADGTLIYAHNLEYDLPIVASDHLWEGRLLFKKSGILWADFHHRNRRIRFVDSTNLFPYRSVAWIGDVLGKPKMEVSDRLIQMLSNGAKWSDFTKKEQELIRKYCIRDAEIVAQGVSELQEWVMSLGGTLQATLAGISMNVFRSTYHKWPWKVLDERINTFLRPSYYGGRVENYVFGKVNKANLYDINSLYPYILDTASFPHPNDVRMVEGDMALSYLDKWEGIVSATVEVRPVHSPPLPYRIEQKLFFPSGSLTGQWTISELRYALDNGAELKTLHWLVGTDKLFNPFRDFIEDLYKLRLGLISSGDSREKLIKLIMNSLYGRFGLNPDKGLYVMEMVEANANLDDYEGWTSHEINGRLVMMGPMNFDRYPAYANVMFAAQVSAGARVELHKALAKADKDMLYCDTDSILCLGTVPTGDDLGDWKCQMKDGKADLLGPKEYALYHSSKAPTYKVKGVPKRMQEDFITTGVARFRRAVKIREGIARNINPSEWIQVVKTHHPTLPKRLPVRPAPQWKRGYCRTVPWEVGDLVHALSVPIQEHFPEQDDQSFQYLPEWVAPVLGNS